MSEFSSQTTEVDPTVGRAVELMERYEKTGERHFLGQADYFLGVAKRDGVDVSKQRATIDRLLGEQ